MTPDEIDAAYTSGPPTPYALAHDHPGYVAAQAERAERGGYYSSDKGQPGSAGSAAPVGDDDGQLRWSCGEAVQPGEGYRQHVERCLAIERPDEWPRALGWLLGALDYDHPGYVAAQAERAERGGYHETAAALRSLVERVD